MEMGGGYMTMPVVKFALENKEVAVEKGTLLVHAARAAGIWLETPCSGTGCCGKCKLQVSSLSALELLPASRPLAENEQQAGWVLACRAQVYQDVTVYYSKAQDVSLHIVGDGMSRKVTRHPAFDKKSCGAKTQVLYADGSSGLEDGDTTADAYGAVIDIGTTTLAAALVDCLTGKEVASVSALNPQCAYAQDVVRRIVGDGKAVGICGSGLIDLVGELVRTGVIETSGRLIKPDMCHLPETLRSRLAVYNGKPAFQVAPDVYLTQMDIRQVQLAKSAIRAGIDAMLMRTKISACDLDRVYIASSFGFHLREESLFHIGMLPQTLAGKLTFVGNTSKSGGVLLLLDQTSREDVKHLVSKIPCIELADDANFEKMFVQYMKFDMGQ